MSESLAYSPCPTCNQDRDLDIPLPADVAAMVSTSRTTDGLTPRYTIMTCSGEKSPRFPNICNVIAAHVLNTPVRTIRTYHALDQTERDKYKEIAKADAAKYEKGKDQYYKMLPNYFADITRQRDGLIRGNVSDDDAGLITFNTILANISTEDGGYGNTAAANVYYEENVADNLAAYEKLDDSRKIAKCTLVYHQSAERYLLTTLS